jgi:hypothetical protein
MIILKGLKIGCNREQIELGLKKALSLGDRAD